MRKLKVGVIGLGMGRNHIDRYKAHPSVDVVAIADTDRSKLDAIGNSHSIPGRYSDALEMLGKEELDIVSVASPNKCHREHSIAALRHGCHVLCEKPMAMNAQEAKEMLAVARSRQKRLMINFSYRFKENIIDLKEQADSLLGNIYFARTVWHRRRGIPSGGWFGKKEFSGGGPLVDLGVHRLDLALWLMGHPKPLWVMGATYNHLGLQKARKENALYDVEDIAVALVRFSNGATLELEASWAANIKEKELMETRLLGDNGGLVQRNIKEAYEFESEIYLEREGCLYDMQFRSSSRKPETPMSHFVDSILNDRPHIATAEEGVIAMELLDAIYESSRRNRPVEFMEQRAGA